MRSTAGISAGKAGLASRIEAVLSEARVLIAEGEWIRGSLHRTVTIGTARQVLGREGVAYTDVIDCFCVAGAVFEAVRNLASESERASENGLWQTTDVPAFERLREAAKGLWPSAHWSTSASRVVVLINDRVVENKDQALRWIDAAIAGSTR